VIKSAWQCDVITDWWPLPLIARLLILQPLTVVGASSCNLHLCTAAIGVIVMPAAETAWYCVWKQTYVATVAVPEGRQGVMAPGSPKLMAV